MRLIEAVRIRTRALPNMWQAIIKGMLERNPRSRLGAGGSDEVLGHPFIAEHMELSLLEQVMLLR